MAFDKVLYADLGGNQLSESLRGGQYSLPPLIEGDDFSLALRFREKRDGAWSEVQRTVSGMRFSLSKVDARATSGTWTLQFGDAGDAFDAGTNGTAVLAYDVSAAALLAALKAVTDLATAYPDFATEGTCEYVDGSWIIRGLDEDAELTGKNNRLLPFSDIYVYPYEGPDGTWIHEIRHIQTPVAWANTFERETSPDPYFEEVEAGGAAEDIEWPERQKLIIPGGFRGILGVRREDNGLETGPIGFVGDAAQDSRILADALNGKLLTDAELLEGTEQFTVIAGADGALISFEGPSLIGVDQDLLVAYVVSAPPGDVTVHMSLNRPELWAALRATPGATPANEAKFQLQIEAVLKDVHNPALSRTRTLYRGEATVKRDIARDGQATGAVLDWLHQHREDHKPVSPDNIITGTHSASDAFGDGVATVFPIDHGLNSVNLTACKVYTNALPATPLLEGTDFSWKITNAGRVTITLLGDYAATPPAADGLYYVIEAAGPMATYNAHTHAFDDIDGLSAAFAAVNARLARLETYVPAASIAATVAKEDPISSLFVPFFSAMTSRGVTRSPILSGAAPPLRLFNPADHGFGYGRLLPAVHDASVEALPSPLPAAGAAYVGKVYQAAAADATFPNGGIREDDFAACDGSKWYRVVRNGLVTDGTFTAEAASAALTVSHRKLRNGDRVQLSTTGTLPANFSASTDYFVVDQDGEAIGLAAAAGGSAIAAGDAGTGTHTVAKQLESSFYPALAEQILFDIPIDGNELTVNDELAVKVGFEAAVFASERRPRDRQTEARYTFVVEYVRKIAASTPGTPGKNLYSEDFEEVALEADLILTDQPRPHRYDLTIARSASGLTATRTIERATSTAPAPSQVAINLRGRLIRFDTRDSVPDPRGLVVVRGLDIGRDGAPDAKVGGWSIS